LDSAASFARGGHGVVVVVWGLVVEQELEEWGHDVEAEWV